MSKILLILSLFIFFDTHLLAQCTPDNSIKKAGFYPTSLPPAILGESYNEVIQFKFIKDTNVIVFGQPTKATIDSMTIVSVSGLPDGLTFKLNKVRPTYTPEEVGCSLVSGVPTKKGSFKLSIALIIYAKVNAFPISQRDTVKNFSIEVNDGTGHILNYDLSTTYLYPNPLKTDQIFVNESISSQTIIRLYNSQGQFIQSPNLDNQHSFLLKGPSGLYFVELLNGKNSKRIKLIKE
jgi:hypothetical protein